jgi:hypothetical protein
MSVLSQVRPPTGEPYVGRPACPVRREGASNPIDASYPYTGRRRRPSPSSLHRRARLAGRPRSRPIRVVRSADGSTKTWRIHRAVSGCPLLPITDILEAKSTFGPIEVSRRDGTNIASAVLNDVARATAGSPTLASGETDSGEVLCRRVVLCIPREVCALASEIGMTRAAPAAARTNTNLRISPKW